MLDCSAIHLNFGGDPNAEDALVAKILKIVRFVKNSNQSINRCSSQIKKALEKMRSGMAGDRFELKEDRVNANGVSYRNGVKLKCHFLIISLSSHFDPKETSEGSYSEFGKLVVLDPQSYFELSNDILESIHELVKRAPNRIAFLLPNEPRVD